MGAKVLCLIDHSLESSYALRFACMLGKERGADVHAMHVIQTLPFVLRWGMGYARKHWEKEQIERMGNEIKRMVESEPRCQNVTITPIVKIGSVKGEVVDQLKRESYDLVVTGVHYSQISQKPYLGTLHTDLIDQSPYPLAMITSFKIPEKVLLYLDGTIAIEKTKDFIKRFFESKDINIITDFEQAAEKTKDIGKSKVVKKEDVLDTLKAELANIDTLLIASGNVELLIYLCREVIPEMLGTVILFR